MSNLFNNPDNLVDMVRQVLSGKPIEEKKEELDPVNKKAVKKKFDDRKDKDIDNDGDVDSTDKYLHKRRKAISKEINEKDMECPSCGKMMTAAAGEKCPECGKMINAAHCEEVELDEAKGDYVITLKGKEMFRGKSEADARSAFHKLTRKHGINDVKVIKEEAKDQDSDGEKMTAAQKKDMDGDGEKDKGEKKKKKKKDGEDDEPKADKVNTEPETDEVKTMMSEREMTDAEKAKLDKMKKKYEGGEMHKAMKAKYGDKADEVFYSKLTKMAMGESVEMNEQIVIKQKVEEAKDEEKDTNLIMQLRKAVSLRGNKVKFADGNSVMVSDKDAQKFMSMFSKLKKPAEKEMMMKSAAKSHKHFKMALSGRVEKPKSGGPDLPKLKSEK
jgi:predicted RNA-binding Zn-ribbon protein involved in translation (DUF1610 family)